MPESPSATLPLPTLITGVEPTPAATTLMSSMPIHSSLPAAFVVMIRSSTSAWLSTAAGRVTDTGVSRVVPGLLASAT